MRSDVLVDVDGLSKHYPLNPRGLGGLRALWAALWQQPAADAKLFIALKDVHFTVRRGESLAIVGENGAGKSTLLKLIAKVAEPSSGRVQVVGSTSALLELGSGFHPEFTGQENIELNAALLGLSPQETAAKLQQIIDFADIGDALYKPVKTYSSGMVVRLGFAIATAMNPDLLITDEVMAVGDEAFQKKCIRWVEQYLAQGGTLLLVSHSMYHVQKLCRKALWLVHGEQRAYGDAAEVAIAYQAYLADKESQQLVKASAELPANAGNAHAAYELESLGLHAEASTTPEEKLSISPGADVYISGQLFSPDDRPPHVFVGVAQLDDSGIYGIGSELDQVSLTRLKPHRFRFTLLLKNLPLLPGHYRIKAHAMDPEAIRLFDIKRCHLTVIGSSRELGVVRLVHEWL
jgi:lipopolysaccharide transport system ATP-binding protein